MEHLGHIWHSNPVPKYPAIEVFVLYWGYWEFSCQAPYGRFTTYGVNGFDLSKLNN